MLVGSSFLSVPLQAAAAFRDGHLQTWKAVQQASFSHGKSNFWENMTFHGKSTLSRAISSGLPKSLFNVFKNTFFFN